MRWRAALLLVVLAAVAVVAFVLGRDGAAPDSAPGAVRSTTAPTDPSPRSRARVRTEPSESNPPDDAAATTSPRPDAAPAVVPSWRVEGTVTSEDGAPLAGALVVVEGGGRVATSASGAFDVAVPADATDADVRVTASGHVAAASVVPAPSDPSVAARADFRLVRGGRVRGVVRDRSGAPVAGASVFLLEQDREQHVPDLQQGQRVVSSTLGLVDPLEARRATAEDGSFEVDGVPFGALHVAWAQDVGFASGEVVRGIVVDPASPERSVDLVLRSLGALEILVLDADGSPVAGASVGGRWKLLHGWETTTGADGRAGVDALELGPLVVTVRAPGRPLVERAVRIEEGTTRELEVRLPRGVALEGVVVDDLGAPVPRAGVRASRPPRSPYEGLPKSEASAVADAEGRFRIEGLLEGLHQVDAQRESPPAYGTAHSADAPGAGVRVVVLRRAALRAKLVLPAGAMPPGELHVRVHSGVHHPPWDDGVVVIEHLDPGATAAQFRFAEFVSFDRDVELRPGETADLGTIALDPGRPLTGRVVDVSQRGVPGARVVAGDAFTPSRQSVTTDATGAFTLEHLPDGPVTLLVDAEGFLGRQVDAERGDAAVVLSRGGLLRGAVHRGGRVLPGAHVQVRDEEAKARGDAMDDREAWERSDARGVFETRLLPGRYRVLVEVKEIGRPVVSRTADVELREGETTDLAVEVDEAR